MGTVALNSVFVLYSFNKLSLDNFFIKTGCQTARIFKNRTNYSTANTQNVTNWNTSFNYINSNCLRFATFCSIYVTRESHDRSEPINTPSNLNLVTLSILLPCIYTTEGCQISINFLVKTKNKLHDGDNHWILKYLNRGRIQKLAVQ